MHRLVIVAGIAFAAVSPAFAKPAAKKAPAQISVENGRKVALTKFEILPQTADAKPDAKPAKPIGALTAPLPSGEKKMLRLKGAKGCSFVARWAFEDASDEGPVDLCGDPKIVLTD